MVTGNNSGYLLRRETQSPLEYSASHLSVQLDQDAIAWAVTDKKSALVTEVGRTPVEARAWADLLETSAVQTALKTRTYRSVSLTLRGMPSVLVPNHVFDPNQAREVLRQSTTNDLTTITHEAVSSLNAVAVMAYPDAMKPIIDAVPVSAVWNNTRVLIDAIVTRHRNDTRAQIYVDISDTFSDVYIIDRGEFKLANTFQTGGAEDVLYHISNCARQLQLDHESTALHLSGNVKYGSDEFKLYRAYHPEVNVHFGFTMPRVDVALSDLKKQEFMSLLNQFQCAS